MKLEYYRLFRSFAMSSLVFIALLTGITVQGQVRFGIKGGMNVSSFDKGLYKIDNFDKNGDNLRNQTISLSVGYKF